MLSEHLAGVFPALDAVDQKLSLALYRLLAEGRPVAFAALADTAGLSPDEATRRVRNWPGVYYDGNQEVIGYWGLALSPMKHEIHIDGLTLYAWCAWDTLFLPALLGKKADVISACRGSGQPVRLRVGPTTVESADAADLLVSFLCPDADAVRADVIASFCHFVHFFQGAKAASTWLEQHPEAFLLSLAEAFELGQRRIRSMYGSTLPVETGGG